MNPWPPSLAGSPRRWIAPLTVCLALLCMVAQFARVAHFALVEHVRCAEHGDLIHAEQDDSHHAAHRPVAEGPRGTAVDAADDDHGHGEDHCLVPADRRDLGLPSAPHATVTSPERAVGSKQPSIAVAHGSASALYLLAPKTSPPA